MTAKDRRVYDRDRFRKKYLLGLAAHPLTVVPFVTGVTALLAAWSLSLDVGVAVFAALACLLGASGTFLTRLVMGDERLSRRVIAEMQAEAAREHAARLDALDRALVEDGDPRTENCLRDLRALEKAFRELPAGGGAANTRDAFDIASGVEELFSRSVLSLEKTLELWRIARDMISDDGRRPVLAQRESIVDDVRKSIAQLGEVLVGVERLTAGAQPGFQLARLREDLDARLAVARRVEERMRSLEHDIGSGVSDDMQMEA